ncbi:MAG: hypothetical protein LBR35_02155 [Rickettsiales bacterium]|nr:hypothetical protein [Rickettsiales bacterium]
MTEKLKKLYEIYLNALDRLKISEENLNKLLIDYPENQKLLSEIHLANEIYEERLRAVRITQKAYNKELKSINEKEDSKKEIINTMDLQKGETRIGFDPFTMGFIHENEFEKPQSKFSKEKIKELQEKLANEASQTFELSN